MKRIGVLAIAVAMTVAACGGSNETTPEPDVEVEAADDVAREAGGDVKVINGCRIEWGTSCPLSNLSGADLSGADLRGADLSGVFLEEANLSGAILHFANLTDANLEGVNLSGANLSGANFSGANLSGANLSGANFSGANLSGADLSRARFCNTIMPDGSVRDDNC